MSRKSINELERVLVLNADFIPLHLMPISTIPWYDAITLIYQDKATAIEYQKEFVRSPSTEMRVPSVVVLKSYKYFKKYAKYNKYNVKLRDGFTCQYCYIRQSAKSLTVDHVLPKSHGGETTWENCVTACKKCNSYKKDNPKIVPKKKPKKPTYYTLAKKLMREERITNEHWKQYIRMPT